MNNSWVLSGPEWDGQPEEPGCWVSQEKLHDEARSPGSPRKWDPEQGCGQTLEGTCVCEVGVPIAPNGPWVGFTVAAAASWDPDFPDRFQGCLGEPGEMLQVKRAFRNYEALCK